MGSLLLYAVQKTTLFNLSSYDEGQLTLAFA